MLAVDTNILVRFWVDDDPKQAAAARAILTSESIWVAKTVLLETAWVLGRLYGYDDAAICNSFSSLFGLPNLRLEDAASVADALSLCAHGVDFSDALHVYSRPPGVNFVTFDQSLVKRSKRAGVTAVRHP